jgi:uncharacterized protein YxjI
MNQRTLDPALTTLLGPAALYIRQQKEWTEILIDWETSNRYQVMDEHGQQIGLLAEHAGGFGAALRRGFFRSHRAFDMELVARDGRSLLRLGRPFFWFFSDLWVADGAGTRLGSVHRQFAVLSKRYELRDEQGTPFAWIHSPIWRLWTFAVVDQDGQERAAVRKKWGGALREMFTDADTYQVDFGNGRWTPAQRAVLLAAAVSIDFDFFENNQGRGGLLGGD